MKKLLALLVAGTAMVACSSNQAPIEAPVTPQPTDAQTLAQEEANTNSVYFAFNKYDIQDQFAGLVQANAGYLASNANASVKVEGNTDDIGSVEYNLSLGQRRADAVKKALIAAGANKAQVEATSNGKLHPKFDNSTDDGRALNRRSDVLYVQGQPAGYTVGADGVPNADQSLYQGHIQKGVQ